MGRGEVAAVAATDKAVVRKLKHDIERAVGWRIARLPPPASNHREAEFYRAATAAKKDVEVRTL